MIKGIPRNITVTVPIDLSGVKACEMWLRDNSENAKAASTRQSTP